MARPLRERKEGEGVRARSLRNCDLSTRGGGKALVAGPLKKNFFCGFPKAVLNRDICFIKAVLL